MASIFTRIIHRELPAYTVAEDERNMAILDINPLVLGHVLVFPKVEVDKIYDLSADDYSGLMLFAQQVSLQVQKAFPDKRVAMAVVGLEVPHAHVHLVPISNVAELDFTKQRPGFTPNDFHQCLERLKQA
ncbi:MAG: HIT family protein [Flavobacteriia bacterium]|nr:HIT family protein [Flavobacteriia bacterium]